MAISSPEMMLVPVLALVACQKTSTRRVHTKVDVTETTTTDLTTDSVLVADTEIL